MEEAADSVVPERCSATQGDLRCVLFKTHGGSHHAVAMGNSYSWYPRIGKEKTYGPKDICFILGARDPEMEWIERKLIDLGITYWCAAKTPVVVAAGHRIRVRGDEAYTNCESHNASSYTTLPVSVECAALKGDKKIEIDHHRPGDKGYSEPPERYLEGSSIGQVLALLGEEAGPLDRVVAAADHCLMAAYAGQCPGVEPDEVLLWRAAQKAVYRNLTIFKVLEEIKAAEALLRRPAHNTIELGGGHVLVFENQVHGLKDAACRLGLPYMVKIGDRIILGALTPKQVDVFLKSFRPDIIERYGDPMRGFAGGKIAPVSADTAKGSPSNF